VFVAATAVVVTQDRLLREEAGREGEKRKRGSGPLLPWPKFNEPVHQAASREEQTKPEPAFLTEPACKPSPEPVHLLEPSRHRVGPSRPAQFSL